MTLVALAASHAQEDRADRVVEFGRSVEGRVLSAQRIGPSKTEPTVIVIGSTHGDETEGHEIVERLRGLRFGGGATWLVETVNPDGVAAGTRGNARGVDLNRNFKTGWQPSNDATSGYYPGPRPRSEPETRAFESLVKQLEPNIVISYHQPWDQVLGPCDGPDRLQRRYAHLTDSEFACRGGDLPGTATKWLRHRGSRAFVVELGPGELSAGAARTHARAVTILGRERGRR